MPLYAGAADTSPLDLAYAAAVTLDLALRANFTIQRLNGPIAISFANVAPGKQGTIIVRQDNVAARSVTFAAPTGYLPARNLPLDQLAGSVLQSALVEYSYRFYAVDGVKFFSVTQALLSDVLTTPSTILGAKCVCDLDCDRGLTFGAGGGVQQWSDQSAQANHVTQATLGSQPPLATTNVVNGHKPLTFHTPAIARATFSGIASAGTYPYIYLLLSTGGGSLYYYQRTMLTIGGVMTLDVNYLTMTAAGVSWMAGSLTRPALLCVQFDTDLIRVGWNNVSVGTATAGSVGPATSLTIGQTTASGDSWYAYRLVVTNDVPTAAEHAAMLAFFRAQYPSAAIA